MCSLTYLLLVLASRTAWSFPMRREGVSYKSASHWKHPSAQPAAAFNTWQEWVGGHLQCHCHRFPPASWDLDSLLPLNRLCSLMPLCLAVCSRQTFLNNLPLLFLFPSFFYSLYLRHQDGQLQHFIFQSPLSFLTPVRVSRKSRIGLCAVSLFFGFLAVRKKWMPTALGVPCTSRMKGRHQEWLSMITPSNICPVETGSHRTSSGPPISQFRFIKQMLPWFFTLG